MTHKIGFLLGVTEHGATCVTPTIDGDSLLDLIASFETARSFTSAGRYGGIIPDHFGDLRKYYLGQEHDQWPMTGLAWLLGCDCGEVGCWPLEARVTATNDRVIWSEFRQPHRPERDYSSFGPFIFERQQFDDEVAGLQGGG